MEQDIQEVFTAGNTPRRCCERTGAAGSARITAARTCSWSSILKGSVVFMADLMRAVTIPCSIDFMSVSSYGSGTKTSGVVKIIKDLDINLEGRDLLLVEDIPRQRHGRSTTYATC